jgi:magnesium transporter
MRRSAVRVLHLCAGERAEDVVDALAAARSAGTLLWVELDGLPGDLAALETALGLDPLVVASTRQLRGRPKLDLSDRHLLCSLTTVRAGSHGGLQVGRVTAVVGEGFLVTFAHDEATVARAARLAEAAPEVSALRALHALIDVVVEDLAATSSALEAALLAAADRLFGEARSDEAHALYELTRELLVLRHAVRPLVEPLRHLSSGAVPEVDDEARRRFTDLLDRALVVDREVSDLDELLGHLRGSNDSRIALQQNIDMRRIAAWAAIIAVPTAVTGFYGMNVPYPGFGEVWGAGVAVLLQVGLAVGLAVLFRRRRWW